MKSPTVWIIEVRVQGEFTPTNEIVPSEAAGKRLLKSMLANAHADKGTPSEAGSYRVSAYARVEKA